MLADFPIRPTLPAGDIERAKRFYQDTLGFKVLQENEGGVNLASGDTEFYLYPTTLAGTAQNTAACWVVTDLDAAMADLRGRGVTFEDFDVPGMTTVDGVSEANGIRGAWFHDTEGNTLAVVQSVE